MAKIITIEGTDCSGKQTQAENLFNYLIDNGYKVKKYSFPTSSSATGKIVSGCYLGKPEIGESYFKEGAVNVDALVASLYYAADRRYNFLNIINKELEKNDYIILDRYTTSNLAHQGGKILDEKKRNEFYEVIEKLEYGLCELPRPDITILLHMPLFAANLLKTNREFLDEHELNENHLKHAEMCYLELKDKYNWKYINCVKNDLEKIESIKTKEEIFEEVKNIVLN